ncbi:hypothetical protein D3C79_741470 [compost metagenome]
MQGRAKLVAHGGQELGLGLVCGIGLTLGTAQLHLQAPQVADPQQGQAEQQQGRGKTQQDTAAVTLPHTVSDDHRVAPATHQAVNLVR